jgi:geranylgeranylglycerol-phosphate geranylgeranyltransferase
MSIEPVDRYDAPAHLTRAPTACPVDPRVSVSERALAVFVMCQPAISVIAACYTLLGAYLAGGVSRVFTARVVTAAVVVALALAYSFAINAYCDEEADRLNEPGRAIPSGRVSRRTARRVALVLVLLALAASLILGPLMELVALGTLLLSTLYSFRLKSTVLLGNAVIGLLNGSIVVYGALAAGHVALTVWLVALLVFMGTLAQEILYTVRDREGDARAGITTISTRYGEQVAVRAFQIAAFCFVGAAVLVWIAGVASPRYIFALLPCTMLPMAFDVVLLGQRRTKRRVLLALRVINLVWVTSLIPILFFR